MSRHQKSEHLYIDLDDLYSLGYKIVNNIKIKARTLDEHNWDHCIPRTNTGNQNLYINLADLKSLGYPIIDKLKTNARTIEQLNEKINK